MAKVVTLNRGQGTSCTVNLHGATVVSWRLNYIEQLFMSKMAVLDNMWPIRGGIPIIFPVYAYEDIHMPNHGFARINEWSISKEPEVLQNGDVVAEFFLNDNPILAANYWQNKFELVYKVLLHEYGLELNLIVRNTSKNTFEYNVAFHAYIKVPNVGKCEILGLENCYLSDKVHLCYSLEKRKSIMVNDWIDCTYQDTPDEINLKNITGDRSLKFTKRNMPDVVVWNPGYSKAKDLYHFIPSEYMKMICIVPGYVAKPFTLEPQTQNESSLLLEIIQ